MQAEKERNGERVVYLDLIRTMAIMCVVLCHSVEKIYGLNLEEWNTSSISSNLFKTVFFTIGRLGVPLFLMLTGYLLLDKNIDNDKDVIKFYKKKLLPIVITTEIWIVIYTIFYSICNKETFTLEKLVRRVCFMEFSPDNMWYMPMIIGIYIAIPFVNKVLTTFSIKILKIPMIVLIFIYSVLPTLNIILRIFNINEWYSLIDVSFLGGIYGFYLINGYLINKKILKKVRTEILIIINFIAFCFACAIQVLSFEKGIEYNIWYNSIFIIICSIVLFELLTRIKIKDKVKNTYIYISKISFGIFFVHEIVLSLYDLLNIDIIMKKPIQTCTLFIMVFILSIFFVELLSKIKILRKKLFLLKY